MATPASPPPSAPPDITDPEALEEWIEARSMVFAEQIAEVIRRIVTSVYTDFIASIDETALTAAGDPTIIDNIKPMWKMAVPRLLPTVEQTFYEGGLAAYAVAEGGKPIPPSTASGWAKVVNYAATDYMTRATNRIVGIGDTVWNSVSARTRRALEKGLSADKLAAELRYYRDEFAGYRADVIARTEINGAFNNGKWESDTALGPYGPVEKVWKATSDARTRPDHVAADGQVRPFSEPFSVGGVPLMAPHAPGAPASQVVNCRCYYSPLYVGDRRPDGSIVEAGDLTTPGLAPESLEVIPDGTEVVTAPESPYGPAPGTIRAVDVFRSGSRGFASTADRDVPMADALRNLDALVGLHDDGLVETIMKPAGQSFHAYGEFSASAAGDRVTAMSITVAARADDGIRDLAASYRATFYHEFGHRLDFRAIKREYGRVVGDYSSDRGIETFAKLRKANPGMALRDVAEMVTDPLERAWADLVIAFDESESWGITNARPLSRDKRAYFRGIHEVWARAFSAWAASAAGDTAAAASMFGDLLVTGEFTEADMVIIRPIVERILRLSGLMR